MVENSDIEKYFLQILPEIFPSDECRALLTLIAGERPGVLLMSVQEEDEKVVENFCNDFNLELRFMGERNELFEPGAFIAHEEDRFSVLEESHGKFYTCSDEAVGKFLGYPEDAIKFYSSTEEDEIPGQKFREKVKGLFERDVLDEEDLKHLQLVDYVPRPEKENIIEAVKRGKKKEKSLRQFDERRETRVAEIYLRELYERFDVEEFLSS
ncbi:hypothetical protein GKQ38_02435 [Candidatus Nanohaloarchaea archaeon]|nr:hypothetical protein GKQ38_02435 [Candidatus Nanohaloarchaea archaeon]